MKLIKQPEESGLCGQCCVAMAAGVSLKAAIEVIQNDNATTTQELVQGLTHFGISVEERLRRVSRVKPLLPKRAIIHICRYNEEGRRSQGHWMLHWDGQMYDPSDRWPNGFKNWRITSALEIYS